MTKYCDEARYFTTAHHYWYRLRLADKLITNVSPNIFLISSIQAQCDIVTNHLLAYKNRVQSRRSEPIFEILPTDLNNKGKRIGKINGFQCYEIREFSATVSFRKIYQS